MGKKVATIMNRLFLGDDNYIFYVSHTEVGDYEEDVGLFIDRNGNEYGAMTNPQLLGSEYDKAFANMEEVKNVRHIFGDSISNFEGKESITQSIGGDNLKQLYSSLVKDYESKYGPMELCHSNYDKYEWVNSALPFKGGNL